MVQDAFRQQRIYGRRKIKANIIEGFNGLNLADYFQTRCHEPVAVENDANCAAAAECLLGSGAGSRNLACATLGTGVGGGLVHKDRPVQVFKRCRANRKLLQF